MDLGDAFYPDDPLDFSKSVPAGRYTASIVSMDISNNVKFGRYVADIFKPEYEIDKDESSVFLYLNIPLSFTILSA